MTALLPSALSCDSGLAHPKPYRPIRPSLPSFDRYDPRYRVQSPVIGLIASCRALHSMLDQRLSPFSNLSLDRATQTRPSPNPFDQMTSTTAEPLVTPQRPNKRNRDDFELEDTVMRTTLPRKRRNSSCSTPRVRRTVPLCLPPGLQVSDFEALDEPICTVAKKAKSHQEHHDIEMPMQEESDTIPGVAQSDVTWTENDDRLLVQTVLLKLNLSSQDWNECAKRLGKDKDSIGRRWRLLVADDHVGLRRGSARQGRMDLDIGSW